MIKILLSLPLWFIPPENNFPKNISKKLLSGFIQPKSFETTFGKNTDNSVFPLNNLQENIVNNFITENFPLISNYYTEKEYRFLKTDKTDINSFSYENLLNNIFPKYSYYEGISNLSENPVKSLTFNSLNSGKSSYINYFSEKNSVLENLLYPVKKSANLNQFNFSKTLADKAQKTLQSPYNFRENISYSEKRLVKNSPLSSVFKNNVFDAKNISSLSSAVLKENPVFSWDRSNSLNKNLHQGFFNFRNSLPLNKNNIFSANDNHKINNFNYGYDIPSKSFKDGSFSENSVFKKMISSSEENSSVNRKDNTSNISVNLGGITQNISSENDADYIIDKLARDLAEAILASAQEVY